MLLRPARTGGLGAAAGRPTPLVAGAAALIGLGLAVAAYAGPAGLIPAAAAALAMIAAAWLAHRHIGGYTGDVLGAAQQVGEIAALLAAEIMVALTVEEFE